MSTFSLKLNGRLRVFDKTLIMGILNTTPDSFYSESRVVDDDSLLNMAAKMLDSGVDILDIGGYSTRPGATEIDSTTEINRTEPVIKLLKKHFPDVILSIDTFRADVAESCLMAGAHMVNDVSGGDLDQRMYSIIQKFKVPYVLMHMRGNPQNMQQLVEYDHLVPEIILSLKAKIDKLTALGISDLIIDPGIGFAKTPQQNMEIIHKLRMFSILERPILLGLSRKSFLSKILDVEVNKTLNATTVLNTLGITNGAAILRVHDVNEAVEISKLLNTMKFI